MMRWVLWGLLVLWAALLAFIALRGGPYARLFDVLALRVRAMERGTKARIEELEAEKTRVEAARAGTWTRVRDLESRAELHRREAEALKSEREEALDALEKPLDRETRARLFNARFRERNES